MLLHSKMAKNESIRVIIWCKGGRVVSRKEEKRRECETKKRTKSLPFGVSKRSRKAIASARISLVR